MVGLTLGKNTENQNFKYEIRNNFKILNFNSKTELMGRINLSTQNVLHISEFDFHICFEFRY